MSVKVHYPGKQDNRLVCHTAIAINKCSFTNALLRKISVLLRANMSDFKRQKVTTGKLL
jgi:hypothetical protein